MSEKARPHLLATTMNKPDTKAKAKRKRHKQNKKKPKANQNNAANTSSADIEAAADNDSIAGEVVVHTNQSDDGKLYCNQNHSFIKLPPIHPAHTPQCSSGGGLVWWLWPARGLSNRPSSSSSSTWWPLLDSAIAIIHLSSPRRTDCDCSGSRAAPFNRLLIFTKIDFANEHAPALARDSFAGRTTCPHQIVYQSNSPTLWYDLIWAPPIVTFVVVLS